MSQYSDNDISNILCRQLHILLIMQTRYTIQMTFYQTCRAYFQPYGLLALVRVFIVWQAVVLEIQIIYVLSGHLTYDPSKSVMLTE